MFSRQRLDIFVNAETSQAQQAFSGLFQKFGEFAFYANQIAFWGKQVFQALEDVYKIAREGAEAIGGDTLAAYEEFDETLQGVEDSAKGLVARGLQPLIEGWNKQAAAADIAREAYDRGLISLTDYNAIARGATTGPEAQKEALDRATEALEAHRLKTLGTSESMEELQTRFLEMAGASESFDQAMLASAGVLESDLNAALITAQQNLGFVEAGFRELGLAGTDVELMLIDLREAQGLLTEEQADSERMMIGLRDMIKNGLVVSLDDLRDALLDGIITWEEYRGLIKLSDEATELLDSSLVSAAEEAREMQAILDGIDGTYNATINISVTGDPIPDLDFTDPGNTGGPPGVARASGGPVWADRPYIVGEQGPEWFVPSQNGEIVPGGGMPQGQSSGAGVTIGDVTIVIPDAGDPEATARAVADYLGSLARQSASAGGGWTGM